MFLSGARGGSPSNAALSIPPAKTTNIVDNQHDMGCLREKASAPAEHQTKVSMQKILGMSSQKIMDDNGGRGCGDCDPTWSEVVAYVKCTQYTVGHVEVRVHLPFGHLAGKVQKRFGVHFHR